MPWQQLKIQTTPAQLDTLQDLLESAGAAAVMLLDTGDQPLLEPPPGATPLWDQIELIGIFTADSDMPALIEFLEKMLAAPLPAWRCELLEDKDWERAWMDHYHPMRFGQRLWVVPSWTPPPEAEAVNLLLDPGLAFGTGTHPTTALCLEWLDGLDLRARCVVDYGCGSGILAIAALLLGAASAIAIDNDPQALTATLANAERNGVSDRLRVLAADDAADLPAGSADVVVANILAGPLIALAPRLLTLLRPGGQIALSGLIRSQQDDVEQAYRAALTLDPVAVREEDWCRVSGQKTRGDTQNA